MSLSETQALLEELTRQETLRDGSREQGQRRFQRFVVRADAELMPMDRSSTDVQVVPVLVRDLGRGGVGFVCEQPLPTGSTWHIAFIKDGYVLGTQSLIIRHCRHIRETTWLVGGQFCIDSGLMALLGVRRSVLNDSCSSLPGVSEIEASDFLSHDDASSDATEQKTPAVAERDGQVASEDDEMADFVSAQDILTRFDDKDKKR